METEKLVLAKAIHEGIIKAQREKYLWQRSVRGAKKYGTYTQNGDPLMIEIHEAIFPVVKEAHLQVLELTIKKLTDQLEAL